MTYTEFYEAFYIDDLASSKAKVYSAMTPYEKTAWNLLSDITDRRGWSQEWDQFDTEIKDEIFATFVKIISETLEEDART